MSKPRDLDQRAPRRAVSSHNPLRHKTQVPGAHDLNGETTRLKEGRTF
ncbi:hypothetical protein [Cupriavidus sp. USMAA2-4]|nr:hypothetical protein [Cupriavidus sp. USMAA2-4]